MSLAIALHQTPVRTILYHNIANNAGIKLYICIYSVGLPDENKWMQYSKKRPGSNEHIYDINESDIY